jgi:S-DNA-T family DNA segregation ATPase FtsK/SpoIIIE
MAASNALFGQGAYAAGHRGNRADPGTDRGTALVKSFSGFVLKFGILTR